MSTCGLKSCFTCFRRTENFLCIEENDSNSGENVEEVFAKHFWFTRDEYQNRIVCTSCWEKIDEFHKFYCEVEKVHAPTMLAQIKLEPSDDPPEDSMMMLEVECLDGGKNKFISMSTEEDPCGSQMMVAAVYKSEDQTSSPRCPPDSDENYELQNEVKHENDEDRSDDDEEDESSDEDYQPTKEVKQSDSESDSNIPLAKRSAVKRRKSKKRPISSRTSDRSESFSCHKCVETGMDNGETFKSFYWMKQHFLKVHNAACYIFCCNKKWPSTRSYNLHIDTQHNVKPQTKKLRCVECARWFKDERIFAQHMFLVHTPEEAKLFKCTRCPKAFAVEDQLNSHIKWHDEVEQRNHHCPICNRYFLGAGNLQNHNISHHSDLSAQTKTEGGTSLAQNTPADDEEHDGEEDSDPESVERKTTAGVDDDLEHPPKRKRCGPEEIEKQESIIKQFVSFNCTRCEFVGVSFQKLKQHNLKVHKATGSIVICCERRFGKRLRLYEHCLRHLNPDHFKCDKCGKTFTDSHGLKHHNWWIHTPVSERPFKCDICGDAFVKDYLLKAHMEKHIEKERKTHTCDQCGRIYTTGLQLKMHMQAQHGALSDWVCDICAKGFTHRALLEQHRLTHSEEGLKALRKQCEKCHRWLTNNRNYLRHKRRCFNPNGPVRCEICGHESVNETALKSHFRLHHSNRPKYACSFCGKEFKKQLRCKEHEANHTGDVLYKCPFCPRMCNSSSNMYTHKKTVHPEQWAAAMAAKFFTPSA
ncbi:transcription factor grauzone-like [Wyeomyia smithii]|uniref:transcription factor grauzone-like n=1 Tax=Wyeomyia smithii TaxID=174621 RepID=UPI002467C3DD|nr:transcription factor grauzone-like [Wyeomyia smithii]